MQSLGWYVRRLNSMSPPEIAWRVSSLFREQADIIRIPLGLIPTLPKQIQSPPEQFKPGFSCSPVSHEQCSDSESESTKRWRKTLLRKADDALDNRLSYFDLVALDHGQPMNWHRDHSAGINCPNRLCVFTDYRDFETYGDCKLVWEPNRHHQLVVLARAWVATNDERYEAKIGEILRSWIDANPFGYGMNWKSPLELGVRIINWIWAIDLIRESGAIDDALWVDVQQSIYRAMWDGQRKFSRGSSANNHLIGEAAGVFVGACYFNTFPNAHDWARKSQVVLEREIRAQSYNDGGTREHAFGYQFFVIQFFTYCLLAGDAAGHPFSDEFRRRLHKLYLFLHELSSDTGSPPNMGDKDNGYVLDLGDLPDNAAALLAVGAEIFDDSGLIPTAPSETVFWLTGKVQQQVNRAPAETVSRSFVDSGYHLMRSQRTSVFFDCAELGYGPIAAHGHADCLSIGLNIDGQPLVVDAGTYDYFTHPDWRNYFRETRAHNTAEVDGQSQSEMLGPFMWGRRATAKLIEWHDDDTATTIIGEHDGYSNLEDPVVHRRSLLLDKGTDSLVIRDSLLAKSRHNVRVHFHLDPECRVTKRSDSEVEIVRGDSTAVLAVSGASVSCIPATDDTKLGWISYGYHQRQPSHCIRLERDIEGDTLIESTFTPA